MAEGDLDLETTVSYACRNRDSIGVPRCPFCTGLRPAKAASTAAEAAKPAQGSGQMRLNLC